MQELTFKKPLPVPVVPAVPMTGTEDATKKPTETKEEKAAKKAAAAAAKRKAKEEAAAAKRTRRVHFCCLLTLLYIVGIGCLLLIAMEDRSRYRYRDEFNRSNTSNSTADVISTEFGDEVVVNAQDQVFAVVTFILAIAVPIYVARVAGQALQNREIINSHMSFTGEVVDDAEECIVSFPGIYSPQYRYKRVWDKLVKGMDLACIVIESVQYIVYVLWARPCVSQWRCAW